jgi:hypothetical protein
MLQKNPEADTFPKKNKHKTQKKRECFRKNKQKQENRLEPGTKKISN